MNKENLLLVTPAPHFKDRTTTSSIMLNVLIAMLPAVVASVLIFGFHALLLEVVCVAACVIFEYLFRKICGRENTISDLSAAVTGLLLAFNLPANFPVWMAIIGCAASILVVKQLFGGIGQNFANPAIVGRIILLISFGTAMTTWPTPNAYIGSIEAVSGATPLAAAANNLQVVSGATSAALQEVPSVSAMLFGIRGGCLGETCSLALIIGGLYLIVRKIITTTIPLAYILTCMVLSAAFGLDPLYQVLSGGLLLGAFFMATDYTTSPATESGKLIFGIGCGVITMLIRAFGSYPEGVSFSILLMNILTPHIDTLTRKKPFGGVTQ